MTKRDLQELCIVDSYKMQLWTFTTAGKAESDLARAKAEVTKHLPFWEKLAAKSENPNNKKIAESYRRADYQIMTFGDFLKLERDKILNEPLTEITAERFSEMLDILPPLAWTQHKGVEMFCMSEFYTGSYTAQYAHDHTTDKYYTKLVDYRDKTTWICEILHPDK